MKGNKYFLKKYMNFIFIILSIIFIFTFWIFLAKIIDAPLILPGPSMVFKRFYSFILDLQFWKYFFNTFFRVFISFLLICFFGFFIGLLCGNFPSFESFFKLPLEIIRVTPVVAFILIVIFWFKSTYVPVFVALMMGLPVMVDSVTKGIKSTEKELLEMADLYRISPLKKLIYIKLPHSKNYILHGAESCFGLSWKVVVAGEVLSLPQFSIGSLMQRAQVHLETADLLALTIFLIFFSFLFQNLLRIVLRRFL